MRGRHAILIVAVLGALLAIVLASAAGGKPAVKLKRVGRFHSPTYVTSAPRIDGLFVVEKDGRIVVVQGRQRTVFLDIGGMVSSDGERGLLSAAFPSDYPTSRLFYIYFTNQAGDIEIAELHASADGLHADPGSLRPVLIVPHPGHSNHDGGQIQFGPDGMLYAGTGDGGGEGDVPDNAQNPNSMLGKLLRINPRGQGSQAATIYSIGLRNPYRFSFDLVSDPSQPRIAIADVGQDRFEEIDYLPLSAANGANFGWNDFEGFAPYPGAHPPTPANTVKPIKTYSHAGGACAVIGGYVVRDQGLPSLFHRYVYGDFCTGKVRSLIPQLGGARKDRSTGVRIPNLSSFGEGPNGALYGTSLNGPVYRFVRRR